MIVLESVPFRLCFNFARSCGVHEHLVPVYFRHEARAVFSPHIVLTRLDQIVPLALYLFDELLCVGRITDALEELDTLFSLQLFQLSVLLDEILLVHRELHALQSVQY